MKQMPYNTPEDFLSRSNFANKAAVRRAAHRPRRNYGRWLATAIAASALIAVVVVGALHMGQPSSYDDYLEQLSEAPIDMVYDITCDVVEYPETQIYTDII